MTLHPEMSLNEIVETYPKALAILGGLGFDTCCGGWEPVGQAAARLNLSWERVAEALTPALRAK